MDNEFKRDNELINLAQEIVDTVLDNILDEKDPFDIEDSLAPFLYKNEAIIYNHALDDCLEAVDVYIPRDIYSYVKNAIDALRKDESHEILNMQSVSNEKEINDLKSQNALLVTQLNKIRMNVQKTSYSNRENILKLLDIDMMVIEQMYHNTSQAAKERDEQIFLDGHKAGCDETAAAIGWESTRKQIEDRAFNKGVDACISEIKSIYVSDAMNALNIHNSTLDKIKKLKKEII